MAFENITRLLDEVAQVVKDTWIDAASGVSTGGVPAFQGPEFFREQYSRSIRFGDQLNLPTIGRFRRSVIATNQIAVDVEYGRGPWDMKPMLLSGPHVRVGKNGARYNRIPFRHGTPGVVGDHFKEMPRDIYEAAKNLKPFVPGGKSTPMRDHGTGQLTGYHLSMAKGQRLLGTEARYPAQVHSLTTNLATGRALMNPVTYQRKSGPFEGMMKVGAPKHNRYITVRTVSDKSPHMSWIHPGWKPHNIAGTIAEKIRPEFERRLKEAAVADAVDLMTVEGKVTVGTSGGGPIVIYPGRIGV